MQSRAQRKLTVEQWQKLRDSLTSLSTTNDVSPMASGPALIARGATTKSITIVGIDTAQYYRFVDILVTCSRGTSRLTSSDILIGKDLSIDLGVHTSDKLISATVAAPTTELTIAGIFDLGNKGFNEHK